MPFAWLPHSMAKGLLCSAIWLSTLHCQYSPDAVMSIAPGSSALHNSSPLRGLQTQVAKAAVGAAVHCEAAADLGLLLLLLLLIEP